VQPVNKRKMHLKLYPDCNFVFPNFPHMTIGRERWRKL
jgi:hypothetical protein